MIHNEIKKDKIRLWINRELVLFVYWQQVYIYCSTGEMLIVTMSFCFLSLHPLTNKNLPSFYTLLVLGVVFGVLVIYLIKVFLIK